MRYALTMHFLITFSLNGLSQNIELDWIEVSGNKVIIHYNLADSNPNHQYLINLFSSQDNFTTALTKVSGDVGQEVKPGLDRKIIWDVTKELGLFNGKLTFEIRGRVFIPYVKLTPFEDGTVFKRGKNVQLTWTSGNTGGQVNIELFQGQKRFQVENNVPNSGRYDWHIHTAQKKGSGYKLRFTNSKDRNDFVESKEFTIKPKIPTAVKTLGIAAVAAIVYVILPKGSEISNPEDKPLADNPGKPN